MKFIAEPLNKEAAFIATSSKKGGKVISKVLGALKKGIKPTPKSAPVGEKVWGLAVKGTTAGAGALGVHHIYKKLKQPKSNLNYTTALRNNILAGNIGVDELSASDMEAVRTLGLH